jgi:transposase
MPTKQAAKTFTELWSREVELSGIHAFKNFAKTHKAHLSGIINFVETHITNAISESINSKIQITKRRARGYRSRKSFINMIYLLCGKLKFNYPLYFS